MKNKTFFAAFILIFLLVFPAIAQKDVVLVQIPENFGHQKSGFEVLTDGRVLVCGDIGVPMDHRAAMYIFDVEGNAVDMTPPEDDLEGMYRDAFIIDDRAMIALRSVPNEYTWRVARLENGKIIWTTEKIENVSGIERIGDRFLLYCKPEPVTAEIRCLDFDGNEEWRIKLEERIILEGILIGEDMHIAYGSRMEDPIGNRDQRSTTLVFAFDNAGNILWRHDGTRLAYLQQYIDAVWTGGGEVIVIDTSHVCKYNEDGLVWEKEDAANDMFGIVPIDDGYLISSYGNAQNGMRLIRVNEEGERTGEFYMKNVPGGTRKLLMIGGTPYLVIYNSFKEYATKLMKIDTGK